MGLNTENGTAAIVCGCDTVAGVEEIVTDTLAYAAFGEGERHFVIIPGISDGLRTVDGLALPLAVMYRRFAKHFRVHVFSRRTHLPAVYDIRSMADDTAAAMEVLGIEKADVLGVSQGGMIAEELTLNHPERVSKLILAVTLARPNPTTREVIGRWISMAEAGDYIGLMADTAEKSYTVARLAKYKAVYELAARLGQKNAGNLERFVTEANACLRHDAYDRLPAIQAPTLVLGGTDDRIVTAEASREIAAQIPGALIHMFEGYGHGLFEEAPDFQEWIEDFLLAGQPGPLSDTEKG